MSIRNLTFISLSLSLLLITDVLENTLFGLPMGGSVSISTLIFLLVAIFLEKKNIIIIFIFWRVIILFLTPLYIFSYLQAFIDYFLAYIGFLISALLLTKVTKKKANIIKMSIFANLFRFIMHFISGVCFFATFASGKNVIVYSLVYNCIYMVPTIVIHVICIYYLFPLLKNIDNKYSIKSE